MMLTNTNIIFNSEQLEAVEKINEFLLSNEKEFTLIGKAGTGKTTILKEIFKNRKNTLGITISHKARNVLSKSIPKALTVASALGMRMIYNENGEISFVVDKKYKGLPEISFAKYIVVDECSMISNYILGEIRSAASPNAKIIYVGDYHQLPPIDESRKVDEDSQVFYIKNKFELKNRVRQGIGNPIVELSDLIADEIETNHDTTFLKNIKSDFNIENNKGYILVKKNIALTNIVKNIQNDVFCKSIAYRTDTVAKYNIYIRNQLFDTDESIVIGDKLIAMDNHYINDDLIFHNSDEFTVNSVSKVTYKGIESYMVDAGHKTSFFIPTDIGYVSYKNRLMKYKENALNDKSQWIHYFSFKDSFANVQHAYSINSHKSQGSTYNTVYTDLFDIMSVSMISDREKLQSLYTAITRASDKLCIMV